MLHHRFLVNGAKVLDAESLAVRPCHDQTIRELLNSLQGSHRSFWLKRLRDNKHLTRLSEAKKGAKLTLAVFALLRKNRHQEPSNGNRKSAVSLRSVKTHCATG